LERLKTYILMVGLTMLFVWFGGMLGGRMGMLIALVFAVGTNFWAYYNSSESVLAHYDAVPVDKGHASGLYEIVERLTRKAGLPLPQIYIIPDPVPNAFATGRDYEHSVVAVTEGLLELLTTEEVEGVIAHELSHIKHYDMLIGTIVASLAGALATLANFGMFFGGSSDDEDSPNPIVMLVLMIVMPLIATLIQMMVSRSREYMADEGAAKLTRHPEWLQNALLKLESYAHQAVVHNATPETSHLFIINPLTGRELSFKSMFSTHPSTEDRVARLEELKGRV